MTQQYNPPAGMNVTGSFNPEYAAILTPDALEFLAKLHRKFDARRIERVCPRRSVAG